VRAFSFALLTCVPLGLAMATACGGSAAIADPDAGPALDAALRSRIDGPIAISARCEVLVDAPPFVSAEHVPVGTHVNYNSNPPSSGPHYPVWAAFNVFDKPVQREFYVHDLEHGAVVLLYKCDAPSGCPEVVLALKQVSDALPDDPLCNKAPVRVRTVITPDPLLDVPVAAAAWGWTYKAKCVDVPSLTQFAKDHYAKGPEDLCADGMAF